MKHILVFIIFLFSSLNHVYSNDLASCSKQELIDKEKDLLIKKENTITYVITIFNKKVKIPKRFELTISGPIQNNLKFLTILNMQESYQALLGCKSGVIISGNIEIGNRNECKLCNVDFLTENKFSITSNYRVGNINFMDIEGKEVLHESTNLAIFFDENHYVYIFDETSYLSQYVLKQLKENKSHSFFD